LLDVTANDVSDRARRGELDETARAGFVGGKIGDVEAAGVEVIAGVQNARLAIVVSEVSGLMAGNASTSMTRPPRSMLPACSGQAAMPKAFCPASTVAGIRVVLGSPSKPLSPAVWSPWAWV
jgi:hypothetical protein